MIDFWTWCKINEAQLFEWYVSVGHSEDWSDPKASKERLNDDRYAVRGVRSKYVANMKADTNKKTRTRKSKKRPK
jgi:hypothetical protein